MMHELRSQSGASTVVASLILLFAITALTIAGLSAAKSNLTITRNYREGTQALLAAEAAKIHAHELINDWGIIRFNTDVVPNWDEIFGNEWREMPGLPGVRYQATIEQDETDALGHLILYTAGMAPGESIRRIAARLQIDLEFSPGAIYLPEDVVEAKFTGDNFWIDGTDHYMGGGVNLDGEDVPGITTRNKEAVSEVTSKLNPVQKPRVMGEGGAPSVRQSYGPTTERIRTKIVPDILALGEPTVVTRNDSHVNGEQRFGTIDNPQVTYFTGNVTIGNGDASGAGVLIVDGTLKINGNFNFTGLIIVRGETQLKADGLATVIGSIWTTAVNMVVGGDASVTYSSEAMRLVGDLTEGRTPKKSRSIAWKEGSTWKGGA